LVVGDVDGRPGDEVVLPDVSNVMELHTTLGPGGLELELLPSTAPRIGSAALADLDGDGRADLLGIRSQRNLEIWRAVERNGIPDFAFAADLAVTDAGSRPLVLDYDGDGALDVIASHRHAHAPRSELLLLRGTGADRSH
jgi:hypothetical protein